MTDKAIKLEYHLSGFNMLKLFVLCLTPLTLISCTSNPEASLKYKPESMVLGDSASLQDIERTKKTMDHLAQTHRFGETVNRVCGGASEETLVPLLVSPSKDSKDNIKAAADLKKATLEYCQRQK